MLNGGKFTLYMQSGLWAEVANTATYLDNHLTTPNRSLITFQQFFGKGKSHVLTSMQKFGEMCIATFKDNTHQAKLANCGIPGIWVGYMENHHTDTYRIFNPKTKGIILIRDVTFLNKSYDEYHKVEKPVILTTSHEGSDEEEEFEIISKNNNNSDVNIISDSNSDSSDDDLENNKENFFDEDVDDQVIALSKTMINTKVIRVMKCSKLHTMMMPTRSSKKQPMLKLLKI